jgi:hypothetical protein
MQGVYDHDDDQEENSAPYRGYAGQHSSPPDGSHPPEPKDKGSEENDGAGDTAKSADDLRSAENKGFYKPDRSGGNVATDTSPTNTPEGSKSAGLYNKTPDTHRFANLKSYKGKATKYIGKHKLLLLGGGISGSGLIFLILIILTIIGIYKIPNFAENMLAYDFARTTAYSAENAERVTAAKIVQDTTDENDNAGYEKAVADETSATETDGTNTLGLLDKFQPNKIIANLGGSDAASKGLVFNYRTGFLGRQILDGVSIGDSDFPFPSNTLMRSLVPGAKIAGDLSFSQDFAPSLDSALKATEIGPIMRGIVANRVRKSLGISLAGWYIGKWTGLSEDQAAAKLQQDSLNKTETKPADSGNPSVNKEATDEQTAIDNQTSTEQGALQTFNDGGESQAGTTVIEEAFTTDSIRGFLEGVGNPAYKILQPLCIAYEGSLQSSGAAGTIDNNNTELQRSSYQVLTASDQQKDGTNAPIEAIGAENNKLGSIENSYVDARAGGQTINTSGIANPEASVTGQVSINDAIFGNGELTSFMNKFANTGCPVITSLWTAGGLAVANLALILSTDGAPAAPEAAADTATDALVTSTASKLATKLLDVATYKKFATDFITQAGATAGMTFIARLITVGYAGSQNNGLAVNTDYDAQADEGTILNSQVINQQQDYGSPMSNADVVTADAQAQQTLSQQNAQQSVYQRYFALANPTSLFNRTATLAMGHFNASSITSLIHVSGDVLNPLRSFASIFGMSSFGSHAVLADSTTDTSHYGIVQWGWTPHEEALIDDPDRSYGDVVQNEITLDNSGQESTINTIFSPCFDGTVSMGELLTQPIASSSPAGQYMAHNGQSGDDYYIVRDDSGNVIGGLCSQENTGPSNPVYGDLVFRWRLLMRYDNELNERIDEQTVTDDSTGATTGDSGSDALLPGEVDNTTGSHYTTDTDAADAIANSADAIANITKWASDPEAFCSTVSGGCADMCESIVAHVWGYTSAYPTAIDQWDALKNTSAGHPNSTNIPVGALVFYGPDASNGEAGHVAVYVGNGNAASSDAQNGAYDSGSFGYISMNTLESWGSGYLGWAEPNFPASAGTQHF